MYKNYNSSKPTQTINYKKSSAIFLFFFLISSVYHLLRNVKATLIMILDGSGANTIPFITTGCVLPFSILVTYIFMKLSSKYNREIVFYYMTGGFLSYFILFTFVLLPNQHYLELSYIAKFLKQKILLKTGFDGLITTIRYWNMALFYTISEVWGSAILIVLAWGFTNENNNMQTAKREYAFWGVGINSAGIFIGFFANLLILMPLPKAFFYENNYQWVFYQLLMAIIIVIFIIALFSYINRLFIKHEKPPHLSEETRLRFSLSKSVSLVRKSSYITYIAIIILSYNIIWNLTEVIWFYKTKIVYGDSKLFYEYMNI